MNERKRNYSPQFLYRYLRKTVIGQDDYLRKLAMTFWLHEKRLEASETNFGNVRLPKQNLLCVGPTGSGKTLAAQTLASLYARPIIIEDLSLYSGTSWRGKDASDLIKILYNEAGQNKKRTESGIIIMDEIDKALLQSRYEDKSSSVENTLLKMLEGCIVEIDKEHSIEIDTKNILFIAAGAFEGIEEYVKKRTVTKSIGFLGNVETEVSDDNIYQKITKQDLISYGCGAQLLGRFSEIAYLNKLGVKDLENILRESKASPLKGLSEIMNMTCGVRVFIDEAGIKAAARKAVSQGTGARGLSQILLPEVNKVLFSLPDEVNRLVISGKDDELFVKQLPGKRERPFAGFKTETVYTFPHPKRMNVEHFAWNLLKEYLTRYALPFNQIQAIHSLLCSIVFFILEKYPKCDWNMFSLLRLANESSPGPNCQESKFQFLIENNKPVNATHYYATYKELDPNYKISPTLLKALEWLNRTPVRIKEAN